MHTELILANINRVITLSSDEEQLLISSLKEYTFRSKEIILKEGVQAQGLWFINKGVVRIFNTDNEGNEHVISFGSKDWWVTDIYSVSKKVPSLSAIEAMEETSALFLSSDDLEILYQKIPKLERCFRIMLEKHVANIHLRLVDMLSASAPERYKNFCDRYPHLMNSLPQKQIASYIGVTPEFYSKMRSKLLRGND